MENGFYWAVPVGDSAKIKLGGEPIIVQVVFGVVLATEWMVIDKFSLSGFDFGPNPQPLQIPEWIKQEKQND